MKTYPCNGFGFTVQILHIFSGNERLVTDEAGQARTPEQQRVRVEEEWMVKLITVYPYGLNDKCHERLWTEKVEGVYTARSLHSRLERSNVGLVRCRKSQRTLKPVGIVLAELESSCDCPQNTNSDNSCAPCVLNFARKTIPTLTKPTAKKLGNLITERIYSGACQLRHQFYEAFLDLINSKYGPKVQIKTQSKKAPEVYLTMLFSDKHVQDLCISRTLRDKDILKAIPIDFVNRKAPTVIFKHLPPIRNKIFNYSKEIKEFNLESFKAREISGENTCSCSESSFKDPHHEHIFTGDLEIVKNDELKWLLKQGPNFREQKMNANFSHIWKNLKKGINDCIDRWSLKEKSSIECLSEWKVKLLDRLKQNLNKLKRNPRQVKPEILKNAKNVEDLDEIHSKFIVTFVDKASNNVALVCKQYYFRILLEELGLNQTQNSNETYKMEVSNEEHFAKIQKRFLNAVAPSLPCSSNELPFIYAIPKLHKNPTKFRFLVSQKTCPLKTLNQTLSKIFKLVLKQHRAWCNAIYRFSGINYMWIADDFSDVLNKIDKINARSKGVSTKQFDFTSLYTSLPKEFLIEKINWCLEKAFLGSKKNFISIYSLNANFTDKPKQDTLSFNLDKIKNIFKFTVEHSYFKLGSTVIKQLKGIGMGWDPAPFIANLALYSCEHQFQANLCKQNYSAAKQNNNNSRFIDDINILNNQHFEEQISLIYPPEITCNRENLTDVSGHFLEIDISIESEKFRTKIFDKRDDFSFDIVKYPDTKSNIPDSIVYNVFCTQLVRYLRVCSHFQDFNFCLQTLLQNFISKGCNKDILKSKVKKTILKHRLTFEKYSLTATEFQNFIK